jgi:histidyl-tRNA synthetase
MGDKVIQVVLEDLGFLPDTSRFTQSDVLVTTFSPATMAYSTRLAAALRDAGLRVATYPDEAKLARQLKYASSLGVRVVIILGPDEIEQGIVTVRDMASREQSKVPASEAAAAVARFLDPPTPS